MKPMPRHPLTILLLIAAAILISGSANATYRADFFDVSKKPTIKFDARKTEWTLSNSEIERVVTFDKKVGSLKTTKFRNLKSGLQLTQTLGSEAEISFVAPLRETPKPLTEFVGTVQIPPSNWNSTDYKPEAWPLKSGETIRSKFPEAWMRFTLPARRSDRAYALILQPKSRIVAEIFLDGEASAQIKAEAGVPKPVQIDVSPANRVVAVHLKGSLLDGPPFLIGLAEQGTAPVNLHLKDHWRFVTQSVNSFADNGLALGILLYGEGPFDGFEMEVHYLIHAGAEPTMEKWLTLVSHRNGRFLMERINLESFQSSKKLEFQMTGDSVSALKAAIGVSEGKEGVLGAALSPSAEVMGDGTSIAIVAATGTPMATNNPIETPHSIIAPYRGTGPTGAFLIQLYLGQYVARGTADGVLPYLAMVNEIPDWSADAINRRVALAAQMNFDSFIAGPGWQATAKGEPNGFGDWVTDRKKLPAGLVDLSLRVREGKMNFGIWFASNAVSLNSSVAKEHPDWFTRSIADAMPDGIVDDLTSARPTQRMMCAATNWQGSLGLSMASLFRETLATSAIMFDNAFFDACDAANHEHTALHALPAQSEAWRAFAERLRTANEKLSITSGTPDLLSDNRLVSEDPFGLLPPFARSTPVEMKETRSGTSAPEYIAALFSGASPILSGDLEVLSAKSRTELAKWTALYHEAEPWLAFSQPLDIGILHLRPALKDRYGYLFLPSSSAQGSSVEVNASNYFVRLDTTKLELISMRTNQPVPFVKKENGFALAKYAPEGGWDLIEIRRKS